MVEHADWWDNPESNNGGTPVVRHAPDSNSYHIPDQDQASKMRASRVGKFATVPEGKKNGASRGFDHNQPSLVHVDPDAPDGGVLFDPASVSAAELDRAVNTSTYPHQVFYKLGYAARDGSRYAASPPRDSRSSMLKEDHVPIAPLPAAPPALFQQPNQLPTQPSQFLQPPAYPWPQPASDPGLAVLLQQLTGTLTNLNSRMGTMEAVLTAAPPTLSPVATLRTLPKGLPSRAQAQEDTGDAEEARPIRRRAPKPIDDDDDQPKPRRSSVSIMGAAEAEPEERVRDGRITGFETLEIPFIHGPQAVKPTVQVFFEIPGLGRYSAYYHHVKASPTGLWLYYDMRYQEGMQHLPAERPPSEAITVTVVATKRSYVVASLGITNNLGVIDIIVLPMMNRDVDEAASPE